MKNQTMIIIAILGLLFAWSFGLFSIVGEYPWGPGGGGGEYTSLSFAENPNYYLAEYLMTTGGNPELKEFVNYNTIIIPINLKSDNPFSMSTLPVLPDDMQIDKYFPIDYLDWELAGTTNDNFLKPGGQSVAFTMLENNVECKISQYGSWEGLDRAIVECRGDIAYNLTPTAHAIQRNDLNIKVRIPKMGIECLDDRYCEENERCENKICVESIPNITIIENITITNITIICPEGFTYNETTEKCEKYPEIGIICAEGTYNPITGKCEIEEEVEEKWYAQTLFNVGKFEVKLWMGIFLLFLLFLIPRRR